MTPRSARRAPRPKWNDEKFPTDAPIDYSDEEAAAWAAGYNASGCRSVVTRGSCRS
jgi:hypothetical protein